MRGKTFVFAIALSLIFSGLVAAVQAKAMEEGEAKESISRVIQKNEIRAAQEINDWYDLNNTRENLSGDYILMSDLDQNTSGYDDLVDTQEGWNPIENFTGTLEGNGYEISDLYIDRPETGAVGLFGSIGDEAEIVNLGIVDAEVKGGDSYVGTLVGQNRFGTVMNSYTTSDVSGDYEVGGLVGRNRGVVSNSYTTGDVTGNASVGALIGSNRDGGMVNLSYSTGNVSGNSKGVGGLVGYNYGTVKNSYATGEVSGDEGVGGLLGSSSDEEATIENSYATGNVSGSMYVGGLAGNNRGTVSNSYATGYVTGEKYHIGGLVGRNRGLVANSYATGDVSGNELVGGLVGTNTHGSTVSNSYAVGKVSGERDLRGLVGYNLGIVSDSFWDIETSGQDESDCGTGLTTDEMTGGSAPTNMEGFDFVETWDMVKEDDEDAVEDGYPILQELSRERQLKHVYPSNPVEKDERGSSYNLLIMLIVIAAVITIGIVMAWSWKKPSKESPSQKPRTEPQTRQPQQEKRPSPRERGTNVDESVEDER